MMPINHSQSYLQRWREIDLEGFLEELCPNPRTRLMICQRVADTILAANSLNPHTWGLTRLAWGLRFNFGRLEAIAWGNRSIDVMVDFQSASNAAARKKLASLRRSTGVYRTAPDSHYVSSDTNDAARLAWFLDLVRQPHAGHLALAASTGINGVTPKGHHPGVVDAIGRVTRRTLPQPDYVTFSRPNDAPVLVESEMSAPDSKAAAGPNVYPEGGTHEVILEVLERDPRARADCIRRYGTRCAVCGMSFEERYGAVASGLIHVHHLQPLGPSSGERSTDPVRDLRPVCPNCHAVIHRRREPYSIKEVQATLNS